MCSLRKPLAIEKLFGRRKPRLTSAVSTTDTPTPSIPLATTPASKEPKPRFGLRIVQEPRNPRSAEEVSIVFVHGLGGSATTTWTRPNTNFWPAWLGTEKGFENARIATFAYNADYKNVFAPQNVLGISDFAKELLDSLDLHYDHYGQVVSLQVHN
jgi:hypothetical protein